MINRLIAFSLKQPLLIFCLVILMAGLGYWSLTHIPIDAFPDVTNVQVQILAEAPGLSPVEVEQLVTFPIEVAMNGLPQLTEVRSISKFGLSVITVVFEDDVDIYFARQLVLERLQSAREALPPNMPEPEMGPVTTGMGEIYQYFLESDSLDLMELRSLQDWAIKPQLRTVAGVTEVNSFGGLVKQYQILVSPEKLLSYELTLADVFEAIENNNSVVGGNFIEHASEQYIIRGIGRAQTMSDLENIVVKTMNGTPIYVKNVAEVTTGAEVRQGAVVMQGRGEVAAAIVMMLKGENSREVIARVKTKIEEINKTLPRHVKIHPYYDQTGLVEKTIQTVRTNLFEGGVLVIVVLFVFLGNIRAALLVASVIPLSMLFAFIGMKWRGLTANLMSLGAIDFGMIVDGAVVMVENIMRRLSHANPDEQRGHVIESAAKEVARPVLFGVLIIIAVYMPILTLQGIEGKMFTPMAMTVGFALLGSLFLALTFMPAAARFILPKEIKHREVFLVRWLHKYYTPALEKALHHKGKMLIGALAILIGSFALVPLLGTEFIPELDEGAILVQPIRMPSISLTESIEIEKQAQKIIMQFPEVEFAVGRLGRPDIATDPMGVNLSDIYVTLKPHSEWKTAETKEELVDKMVHELQQIPGVNYNMTQPIAMRVDELVSGVKSDLAIKLFGDDLSLLKQKADAIANVVREISGAEDVSVEQIAGQTYLNIYVDRAAIARYGLNVADVQGVIEIAIGGKVASEIFEGNKRFAVVVRYPENKRNDIAPIERSLVHLPSGGAIPLSQIARVVAEEGPVQVSREFGQRRIAVECNVRNRDIGSFVGEAQRRIAAEVQLPSGYYLTWGGQFENQQSATRRLMVVLPLSIFIIFALLYTTFGNFRHSLLILANLPFALSGGIFALLIRGLHISVSASIGFIALFGVAVLNGVVLVTYMNQLRAQGISVHLAVVRGASERLRPVLMTALVAMLGFIPMALSHGTGAEVQRPLATVVIGGLVTSTLLTLFILPAVYQWMEARQKKNSSS
ncbi:CusA/CzcA family heavy metal efflux RND transporter [candidate division KSB1 bacterium]|nr:MAG: CusA/CzcA family heavy metal efflux RND transporter [candidate division KSB1 bacterium]